MTATVVLTAPQVYAVYDGPRLLYLDSTMTGAILWGLAAGYRVEIAG